jgi:hypothetical protein
VNHKIRARFLAAAVALFLVSWAGAAEVNLLPNGGFEIGGQPGAKRVKALGKQGMTFESADPPLPLRWNWNLNGSVDMRLSSDAHSGKRSLEVASLKGGLEMYMSMIEVVPGATYTFGGWAKGKGNGRITILGRAYEGLKELGNVDLSVGVEWAKASGKVIIPGNIRTVVFRFSSWHSQQVLVDDLFFCGNLAKPFDVDAVMTTKFKKDDHTLLLVDFDGQGDYRLESGAKLTDDKGGRFGKGVRMDRGKASTVGIPLALKEMPPQGTFEFWFAPDDDTEGTCDYLSLLAGTEDVITIHADTSSTFRLFWRISEGLYDPQNDIQCTPEISRAWFRPGQWHHVAVQWDREAVRFYLDGALVDYSTARPLPFFKSLTAIRFGPGFSGYAWSGVFDEVRVSDIQRYGPIVPLDTQWKPLPVAQEQVGKEAGKGKTPKTAPAPDFAKERTALVGTIPPTPAGAISFDASLVKPQVQDDPSFKILPNTPIAGMTVATVGDPNGLPIRMLDIDGGYWPLKNVPAGKYYVGIWYESEANGLEAPQMPKSVYLNGRAVQLSTHSEPVQVAPGVYYVEAQSKTAEPIKGGDEIGVLNTYNRPIKVARLTLYPKEPARGHGWMWENYGANMFSHDSALRLSAFCGFQPSPGKPMWIVGLGMEQETEGSDCFKKTADGKALAYYQVSNPLGVPLTVKCKAEVRAYFRELVGSEEITIELKPHERQTRELPFTIIPDSRRYSMEVKVGAVNPPSLGWPTADTIDFFKGIRQSVPWPDAFNNEFRRSVSFSLPVPGARQVMSFNGQWESALTLLPTQPPVPAPADLKWEARQVPFYQCMDKQNPQPHGMYLRRKFNIPEGDGNRTWRLLIDSVMNDATAYVNEQKVGNVRGVRTPLLCDITSALHPGQNEVLLVLRDGLANMDPAYVNPKNPVANAEFLDAPGSNDVSAMAVYGVKLLSSPLVTAEDLLVNTSLRKKEITASFTVINREKAARKLKVKATVLDAGKPVMDLGQETIDLAAGANKPLGFTSPWANPVLWGPGSPKLYTLAVETFDAASGRQMDLLRERFGFRECWIKDGRFIFNGAPVRLKGSCCAGGQGLVCGDGVQFTRGSDGNEDFLDEFGCLAGYYTLGGLGNSSSRHNVESNSFWEIETRNVLAGARQYMNHPSLITWDLSNEWLSFLDYGGGDPLAGARRFKAVGDALLALDPSRWIVYDGDGDLHGLWNTYSEHYSNPYAGEYSMRGHSPYLPDSRFWRELDKDFKPGEGVLLGNSRRDLNKAPLMDTENGWVVDGLQPPGLTMVIGEEQVLSPAIGAGRGSGAWYWKQNVDGHRDAGFSIICNYTAVTGLSRRGDMLQCFIMPEHSHHYFSGQKFHRSYSLHNNLMVRSDYDFHWSLLTAGGQIVTEGHDKHAMDSGDLQRGQLALGLPSVKDRTLYTLRLALLADGKFAYGEERDIEVWPCGTGILPVSSLLPAVPSSEQQKQQQQQQRHGQDAHATHGQDARATRKIDLFDPSGQTAAVFKKAGIEFTAMDKLGVPEGKPSQAVLVLGEHAVQANMEAAAGSLIAFAEAGGRIVVLMQDKLLPALPVRTTLEPHEWCSMTFLRTPQHPILKGLDSWDIQFWSPDHVLCQGSYSRPDIGSFVPLIDGAGDHDRASRSAMDWNQLLECYRGQGSYLLCQLPLIQKYDTEPMAREMLARIVAYEANGSQFVTPAKTLKVVGDPKGPTTSKLKDLEVSFQPIAADAKLDGESVVLVDAATLPADFATPADWKKAMDEGAVILVHGAAPAQKRLLEAISGASVEITVQPYAMWEGRGCRNGFTWLTPGLSHIDLYWKDYDGTEGATAQAEWPKLKIEDLCYWSIRAEGAVEHIYPGALVEIPVGKGKLIVDQVRWETTNKKLNRLTSRVVSALMAGLNVRVAPYVPPRALPADIVYKPVDLSAFCNRGFKDDVGDDGKGGWPDQGKKADMREFPTGDQNFGGVPFSIGKEPRTCIVLKSNSRPLPDLYPDETTIPLGFRAEGLCFLHSTSWGAQAPTGIYDIQYTDGTSAQIVLVENENIFGWTRTPAEFPRERGTRSRVAWTGSTGIFPDICVCQMLWVNPKPEVPVKAVRFANPEKNMCPVLIAMTAAVKQGRSDIEAIAVAQAKAGEWLKKGIAAVDAGKDADARTAFQEARKADPKLDAAHQRLCELEERGHDEKAALAAYKAWTDSLPRTPLPYNKIGQILERQADFKGALDAYTKSLEIEWNQPPIIEAKSRLQKLLLEKK